MSDRIRLESIVSGADANHKAAWIVTFNFYPKSYNETPMLTVNFTFLKSEYGEENIVKIARANFQGLCAHLSEETSSWSLEKDAVEALKRGT